LRLVAVARSVEAVHHHPSLSSVQKLLPLTHLSTTTPTTPTTITQTPKTADGVEREVKAVDSEHGKNLQSDAWRQHQLSKHTSNRAHPYAKFSTGSLDTLLTAPTAAGVDARARVAEFYAQHYSANLMRLAVYGREPLEVLEGYARDKFAAVPNRDLPVPTFGEGVRFACVYVFVPCFRVSQPPCPDRRPFLCRAPSQPNSFHRTLHTIKKQPQRKTTDVLLPEHRGVLLRALPIREGHTLQLDFDIPPTDALYRQAPSHYVSHLLGHEGAGSAFALLKARGWATALAAGESGNGISSRGLFYVRVELTGECEGRGGAFIVLRHA
jgi:insulysin